jgi:hypothetical protein
VVAPTELCQRLQHPSSQPGHRDLIVLESESSLSRSRLEQHFGSSVKARIGEICAHLGGSQQAPTRAIEGPPERRIDQPAPIRRHVGQQSCNRIGGIGAAASSGDRRAA